MKNYYILLISFCLLLASCDTVQPSYFSDKFQSTPDVEIYYFGDKYPPTTNVDLYYSAHDVKQQYKVMGHLAIPNIGQEQVKARLSDYAKKIGADAVVILGSTIYIASLNQSDVINADALKYQN